MATPKVLLLPPAGQCKTLSALHILMQPKNLVHFFKCMDSSCSFTCDDDDLFLVHLSAHREQALLCMYCSLLATSGPRLIKHMVTAHGSRKAQCSLCLYRACSETHLAVHTAIAHEGSVLPWYLCKNIAPPVVQPLSLGDVSAALYRCVNGPKIAGVQTCRFLCLTAKAFREHLRMNHSGYKLYTCHLCKRRNKSPGTLIKHYAHSHGFLKVQCLHCDFVHMSEWKAFKHVMEEHADKPFRLLLRSGRAPVAWVMLKDLSASLLSKFVASERPNMWEALETAVQVDLTPNSSSEAGISQESGLGNGMPPSGGMSVCNSMKGHLACPLPTDLDQHTLEERSTEGGLSDFCIKGEDLRELPGEDEIPANLHCSIPEIQSLPSERMCKLHEDNSQEPEPLHQGFQVSSVTLGAHTKKMQEQGRSNSSLQPHNQAIAGGMSEYNSMKGLLALPLPTKLDQHTLKEHLMEGMPSGYCSTGEDRELPSKNEMPANLQRSMPEVQSLPSERVCKLHEDNSQELEPFHQGFHISSVILIPRTEQVQKQGRRDSPLQPHNQSVATNTVTNVGDTTVHSAMSSAGVGITSAGELAIDNSCVAPYVCVLCHKRQEKVAYLERMSVRHGKMFLCNRCATRGRAGLSSIRQGQTEPRPALKTLTNNKKFSREAVISISDSDNSDTAVCEVISDVEEEVTATKDQKSKWSSPRRTPQRDPSEKSRRNSLNAHDSSHCLPSNFGAKSSGIAPGRPPVPEIIDQRPAKQFALKYTDCCPNGSLETCPPTDIVVQRRLLNARSAPKFERTGGLSGPLCIGRRKRKHQLAAPATTDQKPVVRLALKNTNCCPKGSLQTCPPTERAVQRRLPSAHSAPKIERTEELPGPVCIRRSIRKHQLAAPTINDQKPVVQLALKNTDCCPKGSLQTCPPTDRVVESRLPNAHSALKFERTEGLSGPLCIRRRKRKHQLAAPATTDQKPVVQLALKNTDCCPKGSLQTCPPTDRKAERRLPNAHSAPKFERTEELPGPLCIRRRQGKHRLALKTLASNERCVARKSLSGNGHFVRSHKPCSKRSSCETSITIGDPKDSTVEAYEVLVVNSDPEDEVTATTCNGFSYYGLKSRPLNNSKLFVCDSNLKIPYVTFVSARKFQPRLIVPKFGIADFIRQHPCE